MRIIVRDNLGRDVTHEREWYINTGGQIFYYTGDIDGPLYIVDNDYTWEAIGDPCMANNTDGYVYFVGNVDALNEHNANANRISEAVERSKKYIKE